MRLRNVMKVVCGSVVVISVAAAPAAGWDMYYGGWAYVYSVDFQGPTAGSATPGAGLPDAFFGASITEGDLLVGTGWFGTGSTPGLLVSAMAGGPGQAPGGLGIIPGPQGFVELDALSAGRDNNWGEAFSVDEFAEGIEGEYMDLFRQGALGYQEAAADIFEGWTSWGYPPVPPSALLVWRTPLVDRGTCAPSAALFESGESQIRGPLQVAISPTELLETYAFGCLRVRLID